MNNHVVHDAWYHSLGPVFQEGGVNTNRYVQLLNDVLELYMNEISLTLGCQTYFQQNAASHHLVTKV
jgi:hypothetical protein